MLTFRHQNSISQYPKNDRMAWTKKHLQHMEMIPGTTSFKMSHRRVSSYLWLALSRFPLRAPPKKNHQSLLFPFSFLLLPPVFLFLPWQAITCPAVHPSASMAGHHPLAAVRLMHPGSMPPVGSPTPSKNIMKSQEITTPRALTTKRGTSLFKITLWKQMEIIKGFILKHFIFLFLWIENYFFFVKYVFLFLFF